MEDKWRGELATSTGREASEKTSKVIRGEMVRLSCRQRLDRIHILVLMIVCHPPLAFPTASAAQLPTLEICDSSM